MTNLNSILKSRDITLPTKVLLVKAMVFLAIMCGYWELDHNEGWAMKKWCFWTVVLEKTLESPLDCKEIQPVNPKGNQSWYALEGLMLKLKLQYFGHLMQRTDSWCWESVKAGGEGDDRGWTGWLASPTQWTWVWASSSSCWWTGKPGVLQSMGPQRVGHDWETELKWRLCTGNVKCERNHSEVEHSGHWQKTVKERTEWDFINKNRLLTGFGNTAWAKVPQSKGSQQVPLIVNKMTLLQSVKFFLLIRDGQTKTINIVRCQLCHMQIIWLCARQNIPWGCLHLLKKNGGPGWMITPMGDLEETQFSKNL